MIVSHERLERLGAAILERAGSEPEEAALVARHLVGANLSGHDSHGIGMIPLYVDCIEREVLKPNTGSTVARDAPPFLVVDGGRGFGQRIAREAMSLAIERCREHGAIVLALRGSHHVGRVGAYGEQAIEAGFVSVHFVNAVDHAPMVAPFRGTEARFVTNPVCIAVPGGETCPPVVLDMATSGIAYGKVKVANNRGVSVPEGKLIDAEGRPTDDPGVMFTEPRGALLPMGEHKGYGLAFACELLAGIVAGGGTIQPGNPRHEGVVNNMLAFVVDPARLVDDAAWMAREIDAVVAYAKSSPPADPELPVLVAGEPERIARAERSRDGVPIDDNTFEELLAAGERAGLSRHESTAILGNRHGD